MARCCRWGGRTQCKSWTTTSSPRWWQTRWMCAGSTMEASLRFRSSSGSRSRLWRIWASRATSRSGRQTLRRSLTCCCTVRVALALLLHVDRPELGLAHPKTRLKMLNMLRALLLLLALLLHGHMLLDGAGGHSRSQYRTGICVSASCVPAPPGAFESCDAKPIPARARRQLLPRTFVKCDARAPNISLPPGFCSIPLLCTPAELCALELRTWQGSLGSSSTLAFALARTSERPEFRFHVILGLCCLSASWDPIKPNVFHAAGRAHRRQLTILR